MSQMLPEGEVMRRLECADVCPAPPTPHMHKTLSENKELLRQQLLSTSKERHTEKTETSKSKHTRSRQKNRWKLKFHHQALPQEYLDHYEQSLQKASAKKKQQEKQKDQTTDINSETFRTWAQRLAAMPNTSESLMSSQSPVSNLATKKDERKKKTPATTPNKIMTYEDLPYMGEMTLNNSKPRRGRKPKKADICHLIYENYGTVVPGQPTPQEKLNSLSSYPSFKNLEAPMCNPKTDLQNKIISSLLERKLTQGNKRRSETLLPRKFCSPDEPMPEAPATIIGPLHSDHEPLNLCIRDLLDLKLQIQKKFGNIYMSAPDVKSELDHNEISELENVELTNEQPNAISVIQRNTNVPPTASSSPDLSRHTKNVSPTLSEPAQSTISPVNDKFPSYVYWPNADIYMHPLALQTQLLYYQRLAAGGQLALPDDNDKLSNLSAESNATDSSLDENKSKLVLKQISELLDPKVVHQSNDYKGPDQFKKRATQTLTQAPVKRKRSAIFIPPMPAKNNSTTPTAEVSICKFKFTGGSKPSLQEKKMLSVDSGGNFRYYSGTGSKGNKGYEFLQKVPESTNREKSPGTIQSPNELPKMSGHNVMSKDELNKKKRKSRKTLQREKLEQTFKEKGFLIQTQQLQSAEGATYCKFRQLRKFTRYLFRSWKDYLPGELDERATEDNLKQTDPTTEIGEWR